MTVQTPGQRINALQPNRSIVIEKIPSGGSLEASRTRAGNVLFYWRYGEGGRTRRVPIGAYDALAAPKLLKPTTRGYGIAAALEAARELAKRNADTPGGLRAAQERDHVEQQAQAQARERLSRHTLKALCIDYCDWLKSQKKQSEYDARNALTNHVINALPDLAAKPACEVTKADIVAILRRLIEASKDTTARKVRAYLRAAFACALIADSDATLPSAFAGYNVTANPVEATAAIKSETDKNPLPASDLRSYWKALQSVDGEIGAALRLHILTGGQRPAQLVRVKAEEDLTQFTMRLWDPKGQRSAPREHLLPMTAKMRAEIKKLPKKGFILSTNGGVTAMDPTSLWSWAAEVAKTAGIKDFQLKRVRSGIETLLAQARVSKEIRGQLQSHGLGGVQDRSYDAHDYLPEKREALQTLYKLLEKRPARNVAQLPSRKARQL
jgi:hypothetical protein